MIGKYRILAKIPVKVNETGHLKSTIGQNRVVLPRIQREKFAYPLPIEFYLKIQILNKKPLSASINASIK